ncbi:MAG: hypothetical protein EHM42_04020, partial [Planctomycetaceae bacterium]
MGGTVDTVTIDSAPDVPVFRLAWLGDNPGGLPLLTALVREANAKLVAAAECGALTAVLTQIDPGVRIEPACEGLLPLTLDAVVVAGDSEATLQGARRLA